MVCICLCLPSCLCHHLSLYHHSLSLSLRHCQSVSLRRSPLLTPLSVGLSPLWIVSVTSPSLPPSLAHCDSLSSLSLRHRHRPCQPVVCLMPLSVLTLSGSLDLSSDQMWKRKMNHGFVRRRRRRGGCNHRAHTLKTFSLTPSK